MRPAVGILISAWVVGIFAGVFSALPLLLGACIVSFVALAYHLKYSTQLLVACSLVVLLGFSYGHGIAITPFDRCEGVTVSRATVARVYGVFFSKIQYVFKRNDGCTILVDAPREPILSRGTIVQLYGSQVHATERLQDDGIDLIDTNGSFDMVQPGYSVVDGMRLLFLEHISRVFSEPESSLLAAMLLGDTSTLSQATQDAFRASGITHILSISGLHFAIIIALLTPLVRLIPMPPVMQTVSILSFLWVYIWAIGSPPSAIRAGMFWALFTLAYRIGRLTSLVSVILISLAIATTLQPMILRSVGFELSVAAIAGIWIAVRFFRIWSNPIWSLCIASLGATLGTLPIILFYFGATSILSPLTNLVVVPLLPFVLGMGIAALVCSFISMPFALLLAYMVHLLIGWILLVATSMQRIPYGYIEHISIPSWAVFLYYVIAASLIIFYMLWKKISLRLLWV